MMTTRERQVWSPFFSGFDPFFAYTAQDHTDMASDVTDTGDAFILSMDVPGVRQEDISLNLERHVLTVKVVAPQTQQTEDSRTRTLLSERCHDERCRSFTIRGIDEENIHATYEHGVLTVTLPKVIENHGTRHIALTSSSEQALPSSQPAPDPA